MSAITAVIFVRMEILENMTCILGLSKPVENDCWRPEEGRGQGRTEARQSNANRLQRPEFANPTFAILGEGLVKVRWYWVKEAVV